VYLAPRAELKYDGLGGAGVRKVHQHIRGEMPDNAARAEARNKEVLSRMVGAIDGIRHILPPRKAGT
jgi:hypothetical protein